MLQQEGEAPYDFARLDLTKPDGRGALVTFTACFCNGDPTVAPTYTLTDRLTQAFSRKQRDRVRRQTFQVQVLVESPEGITDLHRQRSRRLLGAARTVLIGAARTALRSPEPLEPAS